MRKFFLSSAFFVLVIPNNALSAVAIRSYQPMCDFEVVKEMVIEGAIFLVTRPENIAQGIVSVLQEIEKYEKDTQVISNDHDDVVGFVTYAQRHEHEGYIYYVVVREDMRGKGFGSRLLRHAIDDLLCRGLAPIKLTCIANTPAKKQYERIGFEFDENVVENKCRGILNVQQYDQWRKEHVFV